MSKNYVRESNRSGISDSEVLDIRLAASSGHSVRAIARDLYIPKSTVHDIITGKTWSHVPNPVTVYKNYNVYPDGRVFSNKTNKFLSRKMSKDGTLSVELQVNGSRKTVTVATLVAKAFLGKNTSKLSYVDQDSSNVHFTNLSAR